MNRRAFVSGLAALIAYGKIRALIDALRGVCPLDGAPLHKVQGPIETSGTWERSYLTRAEVEREYGTWRLIPGTDMYEFHAPPAPPMYVAGSALRRIELRDDDYLYLANGVEMEHDYIPVPVRRDPPTWRFVNGSIVRFK